MGAELGDVIAVGDFGVGGSSSNPPSAPRTSFISTSEQSDWSPANGGGFQSLYSASRIFQMHIDTTSAAYVRYVGVPDPLSPKSDRPWTRLQDAGTSDINFKKVTGDLDINASLLNIEQMDFKTFYYLDDEEKTVRRGVIAQDIEKIDPQYVHSAEKCGKMTLDLNPLLMDALAAIKALSARVNALERGGVAINPDSPLPPAV